MMNDPQSFAASERPVCVAVIICNEIIEDKRSNNKTLVSLFNGIAAPQLPTVHPRMFLMASLTSGSGRCPLTFRIKTPSDKELVRFDGEAVFNDPLAVVDIVVEIQGLQLDEAGTYFVDVMTGDYPLGHRRFNVQVIPPPQGMQRPQ